VRQVFQSLDDGTTQVIDVPAPQAAPGHVIIRTQASIVSAGTERMLVEFGNANLLQKARQQPERVQQVIDKARTDGIAATLQAVRSKLARPIPLGYANAGVVLEVGRGVDDLTPGDRVVSNGPHAEVVSVPRNLVVKVPGRPDGNSLTAEEAAFAPIGAIALQGVRLAEPTLGERFVVTGLGLVGLLAIQLLRAAGCEVLGLDLDPDRVRLAADLGARTLLLDETADPVAAALAFSGGVGTDGVLITASTKSSEPVRQAARMCRKRGRIVLVGVTGLELSRDEFYEKELTFQVSCSYGPGRYDAEYEEKGHDYPVGFVRWTAGRNFEAFARLVADGRVDVQPLITHRLPLEHAAEGYMRLASDPDVLGLALGYPHTEEATDEQLLVRTVEAPFQPSHRPVARPRIAVIGAGNYTQQTLLPALADTDAVLHTIVSQGGATAALCARRFNFHRASTDVSAAFDDDVDAVFITTRHDTHAELTIRALEAERHVYCEKPLALTLDQLEAVESAYAASRSSDAPPQLMVGFNRRYAPLTIELVDLLADVAGPRMVAITVNAGAIPADDWTQDSEVGGGRIVGEAVHFLDLARHITGSPTVDVTSAFLKSPKRDTASMNVTFADGSLASVLYIATGHPSFPKERVEVFAGGRVARIDNWRSLDLAGFGRRRWAHRLGTGQDKGHRAAVAAFIESLRSGASPGDTLTLFDVSRAAIRAANS